MRKPEFEQFRSSTLRRGSALPQQQREPFRQGIVALLEDSGQILVQRARKDGHDEAMIEVHAAWVGTDFSVEAVMETLRNIWPGSLFQGGEERHWMESEEEVVDLWFVWKENAFITGHVKITVG